jgi:L-aminopeptidase/D-esterase-like protein
VVGASIFDLPVEAPPGPDQGRAAALDAGRGAPAGAGRIGAGAGATVGKWRGREHRVAGGLGTASGEAGGARLGALAVCNAAGDVIGPDGTVIAGSTAPATVGAFPDVDGPAAGGPSLENTTLVVVATDATLSKVDCHLLAQSAHSGLSRCLHPAHTRYDGDVAVVLATGDRPPPPTPFHVDRLLVAVADVVAEAVRAAVTTDGDRR